MTNIIVTGGAGFIGSHLCRKLLENPDNHIRCIDNYYTGSEENISDLFKLKRFTFHNYDIVEMDHWNPDLDEIYNLACPASPIHYQKKPIYTIQTNVMGVLNLLKMAVNKKAKILQASTSEVYGDPLVHPQSETYLGNVNPIGTRACYDEGKRCAETLFFDFHRTYGIPIKVARIFNTYGPNMHPNDGRVVSNFIVQALKNANITIYGTGEQTRSFCYVDDMVDGLIALMNSDNSITGPINLGNPNEFTVLQLSEKIIEKIGLSKLRFTTLPEDDPKQRKPDITLAKKLLGWEPKIQLNEGLDKTIEYFKEIV